jgi:P-aminobenzoate N-oxygenase AurF
MSSTTPTVLPKTADRARRLVAASERATLDPFIAVDWSVPVDDSAYHLPPEMLPLYDTAEWHAMSESERITYSRHETAALCGAGIWFENVLMQAVLRHLSELPVTDPSHRYLLVEVADECRHSTMFGEYIRRSGTPAYRPAAPAIPIDDLPGGRAMSYLLILAVEELLDYINRATMRDERVHTVSRQIAKVHVLEEARHVSFAKTYLAETWPMLDAQERATVSTTAAEMVSVVADLSVDARVYEELGIDHGEAIARRNPHHRATIVAGLTKLTTFLTDLGVIDDVNRDGWIEHGLLAA